MRHFSLILSACTMLVALQGCVSKRTPIVIIGRPQFVPQSPPDSLVEKGIRQDPNTGGMLLQWYTDTGAVGYRIYRSDTTNQERVPMHFILLGNVISSTAFDDTLMVDVSSVLTGVRHYYYLTAYSSDGTQSIPSDTINYKLLNRAGVTHPIPNVPITSSGLYFEWEDFTGGGYTVVRVEDISLIPAECVWITPRFEIYGGTSSMVNFNFDGTAAQDLISGHSYRWRVERFDVDGTGRPYEGSTSPWSTFTVK